VLEYSIGVQRKLNCKPGAVSPKSETNAVDGVAEAIGELLMGPPPVSKIVVTGPPAFSATCQTVEAPVVIAREHLRQLGIATSVIAARYKVDP